MALSLVHSFQEADYPFYHVEHYTNPLNSTELYHLDESFKRAIGIARLQDYKILKANDCIEARFKNFTDSFLFSVARRPWEKVEVDYFHADPDSTNRKLDKARKILRRISGIAGLEGAIDFEMDRREKCIAVLAKDGHSFIRFDRACRDFKPGLIPV